MPSPLANSDMSILTPTSTSLPRRFLRDLSIRTKLVLLATTSVAMALSLAFAGMAANDISFIRKSKIDQLRSQAQMLAFNSSGVLAFGDASATEELLASLAMYPFVEYASVLNEQGTVLAEFRKSAETQTPIPISKASGVVVGDGFMEVVEEVSDGSSKLGSVYVRTNMSDVSAHIRRYLVIASAIMACSLIAAGLLTWILQNTISTPINTLATAAKTVKELKDYTVRVRPRSNDELGHLSATFNAMLDEIESSKAALQSAHDDLENQVAERTVQLRKEIEQRKVVQVALEQARDDAEAASRAKSEFLANMSHEIRTPLNGILGFTELLNSQQGSIDEATQREYLAVISKSGDHLLSLINDILDLSKIEAGQMEIEIAPVSPHDVINQVVSVLRARAQQKGLALKCNWNSSVPESILTDGGRLRQLLMNLIGNAIKFTHQGHVAIEAELRLDCNALTIRVVDTGIGIARHKQADIFDPFVQADNSVTRQYGGTGLGLAISKRIATALGGSIQVLSEEGQGSTFTLQITTGCLRDVKLVDAPVADALTGRSRQDDEVEPTLPPCRILLVEDGAVNRKLVQIMLEEAGAQVETAENGWVGFQLASKKPYDIILMDMQMPVMDGYMAASKLRALGVTVPILALTAHAMKGDDQKCLVAGCTAYLTKPIQAQTLIRTLAEHLSELARKQALALAEQKSSRSGQSLIETMRLEKGELVSIELAGGPSELESTLKLGSGAKPKSDVGFVSTLPLANPVYQEIVNEFVDTLEGLVSDMRAAYSNGDFDQLSRLAHGLKGAGGTAGFDILTAPTASLQKCQPDQEEEVERTLDELSELVRRICETPQVANPLAKSNR